MDKDETLKSLRANEEIRFDDRRFEHLVTEEDLYWRRAFALILAENGYSSSGIANELGVTQSTVKGYLDDLTDKYQKYVIESHPKHETVDQLWPDGYTNPFEE